MKFSLILLMFFGFLYSDLIAEENFILLNGQTGAIVNELGPDIDQRFTPCSTFKIALSLTGYDAGILNNEKSPVWNFQEGYDDYLLSWQTQQTPQSWMKHSCLWFSKVLAFKLGLKTLQHYLQIMNYGNQDLSGEQIQISLAKPVWLNSSLKISPREQVEFIQKIVSEELPFSKHSIEMTKSILFLEELQDGWKLFGKTGGSGSNDGVELGWFVGWIEQNDEFFPFAYNVYGTKIDLKQRIPRAKQLLRESIPFNFNEDEMQRESLTIPEIKLVGIQVQTSYEQELDKMKGKIFPCVVQYFHGGLAEKIPSRKKPGTTFCAYTDYKTDYKGEYTYFIGEEVSAFESSLPDGFQKLVIPEQEYVKFTTRPAPMPDVIVNAWKTVLAMSEKELGGQRSYKTDFEIYDERAADHQNIVLDLYIGITP